MNFINSRLSDSSAISKTFPRLIDLENTCFASSSQRSASVLPRSSPILTYKGYKNTITETNLTDESSHIYSKSLKITIFFYKNYCFWKYFLLEFK